jgi:hypothetical protein
MQAEIEKDKALSLRTLERGLADACADDLTEVLINLESGTCDYVELIPVLEEVARVDNFCYFDDNGAGGMPRPDQSRQSSFRSWALKAIENIRENTRFEATGTIAGALKSNSTQLIRTMLERLKMEGACADNALIPILEKIVRKDVYDRYSYVSGFKTDCQLGELAREVIQVILRNSASPEAHAASAFKPDDDPKRCPVCSSLPDDITVNTGRDEYLPNAYNNLVGMDSDFKAEFLRCPGCKTYFNWIDMPQFYGSGNNDEERLVRLSSEQSRLLDILLPEDSTTLPRPDEIANYINALPLDLLLPALSFRKHRTPEVVGLFVPHLVRLLGKNNDTSLWSLLNGYVSNHPERAQEILDAFSADDEFAPNRLNQILHHCLRVVKTGKGK